MFTIDDVVFLSLSFIISCFSCYFAISGTAYATNKGMKQDEMKPFQWAFGSTFLFLLSHFCTALSYSPAQLSKYGWTYAGTFFVFATVGTYFVIKYMTRKLFTPKHYAIGSVLFFFSTVLANYGSYLVLTRDVFVFQPVFIVITLLIMLGIAFPFYRLLSQLSYRVFPNLTFKRKVMWSVLMGLAFAGVPFITYSSLTNIELYYPTISILHADIIPYAVVLGSMIILWLIPDLNGEDLKLSQERMILESEANYQSLFDLNPLAAFTIRADATITNSNQRVYDYFGYRKEDFIGKTFEPFIHPNELKRVYTHFKDALNGIPSTFEVKLLHRDGKYLYTNVLIAPMKEEDTVSGVFALVQNKTKEKEAEAQIEKLAYHDHLTGLPNRLLAEKQISAYLAKNPKPAALLVMDLDRFKVINDTLGHAYGDLLLQGVANRFKEWVKDRGIIARMSGDEFIIFLPDVKSVQEVKMFIHHLLKQLHKPLSIKGHDIVVSTSIGVTMYPEDGADINTLLRRADISMYVAKKEEQNSFIFYSTRNQKSSTNLIELEEDLRKALTKDEFLLHYQPKQCCHTGKIIGVEALLRWKHGKKGLISPAEFIPLAEETGLIIPIGEQVIDQALKQLKVWHKTLGVSICMAINVSARQVHHENFLSMLTGKLMKYDVDPQCIEIELTENTVMKNSCQSTKVFERLKDIGMKIAIDDFGVEYSSLNYLKNFTFDTLKIDRSFIADITTIDHQAKIVEAIIAMGRALDLVVVAEGVETKEQVDWLKSKGCDVLQGYYIGRPMEVIQVEELLTHPISN